MRAEGKEYIVQDGDVMNFLFIVIITYIKYNRKPTVIRGFFIYVLHVLHVFMYFP